MTKVGSVIGNKYEILKQIGQGGMSVVYLARDIRLNKQWALKEIKNGKYTDEVRFQKSLQTEANVLKMLDHQVLPRIVDVINEEGTNYVVMDYIEGKTMDEVLHCDGAQPQDKVIHWAKQLCSALSYLHSMNPPIIYRDMKPSNIMLKSDGDVKLIDFGTAKELSRESTADTTALGTKGYAAPEQFGDEKGRGIHKTDERTDIYSLGTTLYHIVTGKNPCKPPYGMKPIRYWDPSLSNGLEKIIKKCTLPNPDERYQTCEELMYDLEHYEELDVAYKKNCLKKMKSFVVSFTLSICFAVMTIIAYTGNEKEQFHEYEELLQEGLDYTVHGKYEDAASAYVKAITTIDGSRSSAYVELMNLYTNYIGDTQAGLNRVTYYIDQKYWGVHKNQELLFNVALNYFEILKDYKTSCYYFSMLDQDVYPQAQYYSAIATAMSGLNADYEGLMKNLQLFELENDNNSVSVNKLMNYYLLCVVYERNMNRIENAAQKVVENANKGLETLEKCEDDAIKAEYYVMYNQYLSLAYMQLGERPKQENSSKRTGFYMKSIECCDAILGMVSAQTGKTIENIEDYKLREAKYCQKAKSYEEIGMYKNACEVYEEAEKEYKEKSISIYVGHLSLYCKMEEQKTTNIENWDFDSLYDLFQKGNEVPGIEKDYRWKQLSQKLSPLFRRNGV